MPEVTEMSFWEKLKCWVSEQIVWAEFNLKGKSGSEKKKAIIDKVGSLVELPWYLAWGKSFVINWVVSWLIDTIVEKFNWLTNWTFGSTPITEQQVVKVAKLSAMSVPMSDFLNDDPKTIDEKLEALCKKYGIEVEETPTSLPKAVQDQYPLFDPNETPEERTAWEKAMEFTAVAEGGKNFKIIDGKPVLNDNAKADKGGFTAYGITEGALRTAHAQGIISHCDITKLTPDEAKRIFKFNYWEVYEWDKFDWRVALCCFDTCVLQGIGGAAKIIQLTINELTPGALDVDGKYGVKTKASLFAINEDIVDKFVNIFAKNRLEALKSIMEKDPTQSGFTGWLTRVENMRKACGV